MTELAVIDPAEARKLAAILGTSSDVHNAGGQDSSNRLPLLKINLDDEDEEGNSLPRGQFMVTGQDEPVFAKSVSIRPLSMMFQWLDYSAEENKTVNRTIIIPSLRMEARDEKGTFRCGKPPSKVLREDAELAAKYKSITCFRYVHCLVSYEGTTASGEKATVENLPALFRLKGANFSPFEDQVVSKLPKGRNLHDYNINVTASRKKNGSVVYYVFDFDVDFSEVLPLDQQTYDSMVHVAEMIKSENSRVEEKHKEALRARQSDDDAIDAIASELEDDLEDVVEH